MHTKFEFLKTRGDQFLEDAIADLQKKNLEIGAFHLEQVCQFYLKYTIGLLLGDFPHVHNLSELMDAAGRAMDDKEFLTFYKQNKKGIEALSKAYFDARYYDTAFERADVDEMLEFTQKLRQKLQQAWT